MEISVLTYALNSGLEQPSDFVPSLNITHSSGRTVSSLADWENTNF